MTSWYYVVHGTCYRLQAAAAAATWCTIGTRTQTQHTGHIRCMMCDVWRVMSIIESIVCPSCVVCRSPSRSRSSSTYVWMPPPSRAGRVLCWSRRSSLLLLTTHWVCGVLGAPRYMPLEPCAWALEMQRQRGAPGRSGRDTAGAGASELGARSTAIACLALVPCLQPAQLKCV
jgi:hypothetical protein